jgi:hypothetical protein
MMIDSASALQGEAPNGPAADKFLAADRLAAEHIDANDILYSLESSFTYDPQAELSRIKTELFALNFDDDEFNPDKLQVLQREVPKLARGRYVVQPGTLSSPGHLTMTRPDLGLPCRRLHAVARRSAATDKQVAREGPVSGQGAGSRERASWRGRNAGTGAVRSWHRQ